MKEFIIIVAAIMICFNTLAILISFFIVGFSVPIEAHQIDEGYAICQKRGDSTQELKSQRN